jgi:hypothetical protein
MIPSHHYIRVKGSYLPTNAASLETTVEYVQGKCRGREREREGKKRFIKMHDSYKFHKLLMLPNPFQQILDGKV